MNQNCNNRWMGKDCKRNDRVDHRCRLPPKCPKGSDPVAEFSNILNCPTYKCVPYNKDPKCKIKIKSINIEKKKTCNTNYVKNNSINIKKPNIIKKKKNNNYILTLSLILLLLLILTIIYFKKLN